MFDLVRCSVRCPLCHVRVTAFNTLDGEYTGASRDYRDTYVFHALCVCGAWIEFRRKRARSLRSFTRSVRVVSGRASGVACRE